MTKRFQRFPKIITACLSVATVASLAACGSIPEPKKSDLSQTSVVTLTQEEKIRSRVIKDVVSADANQDVDALAKYAEGPELAVRTAQLTIAKATKKLDPAATIPTGYQQLVVPVESRWPRSLYTITSPTEDRQTARILVFSQDSARTNYKLWGLVRMLPGVTMPTFAIQAPATAKSSETNYPNHEGTADEDGLIMTPQEAVKAYADYLQKGTSSSNASKFDKDAFSTEMQKLTTVIDQGIKKNGGSQRQEYSFRKGAIRVLVTSRTSNASKATLGALVIAEIDSTWTRTAGKDRKSLPISDSEKTLFGQQDGKQSIEADYVNVVALYVPFKGDKTNTVIRCVGSERVPVSVQAK